MGANLPKKFNLLTPSEELSHVPLNGCIRKNGNLMLIKSTKLSKVPLIVTIQCEQKSALVLFQHLIGNTAPRPRKILGILNKVLGACNYRSCQLLIRKWFSFWQEFTDGYHVLVKEGRRGFFHVVNSTVLHLFSWLRTEKVEFLSNPRKTFLQSHNRPTQPVAAVVAQHRYLQKTS